MRMMLWGLRVLLVALMLFLVGYTLSTEWNSWCTNEYSRYKGQWDKLVHNLSDTSFTIPEHQRQPELPMREFYQREDRGLTDLMMRTRLTFRTQHHLGTVLRDGFHIDLPPRTMWKGGVLVVGEDVAQQMEQAKVVPTPPSAGP